jgi:AraC-like DNA-binding protein
MRFTVTSFMVDSFAERCAQSMAAQSMAVNPRLGLVKTRRPAQVVVSDPRSGRRVDVTRLPPPPPLLPWVERFWGTRWDLRGQAPHHARMLSDPTVHVVVERGRSRVVGVHRERFARVLEGEGRILGTQLWPGAVTGLSVCPASAWTDRVVPLAEVVAIDVVALEDAALAHADDAEAFAVIAATLRPLLRPLDDGARLARAAVEHVTATPGVVRAAQLEAHLDLDPRALQRLFARCIGVTPKWVIRRVRLQEAAARLAADAPPSLAELAATLGYVDQAHFARDFKAVVGLTPGAFVRQSRPA